MLVSESRRSEMNEAFTREQEIYERRMVAYVRVKEAFVAHDSNAVIDERLREAERINDEWREAKADLLRATIAATIGDRPAESAGE